MGSVQVSNVIDEKNSSDRIIVIVFIKPVVHAILYHTASFDFLQRPIILILNYLILNSELILNYEGCYIHLF